MTVEEIIKQLEVAIKFSDKILKALGNNCTPEEKELLETAQERFTEVLNYCLSYSDDYESCYSLYKWVRSLYGDTEN